MLLKDVSSFEAYTFKTPSGYDDDSYTAGVVKVLEDLDELPTIDAVPVVRCKDCKQFMEFRDSEKEKQGCDGTCYRLIMHCFDNDFAMVNATDYCKWGKNRCLNI